MGTQLCPVAALLNLIAVRHNGNGPLFVHDDGFPLTQDQFIQMTKHALQLAKMETSGYSSHSFRIHVGAATAAAAAGVQPYLHQNAWPVVERVLSHVHLDSTKVSGLNLPPPGLSTNDSLARTQTTPLWY